MSAAVTASAPAQAKRDQADAIYREIMAATWPSSREAMAAIGRARGYLAAELGVHTALVTGDMEWWQFDTDLEFFDGDPQDAAVERAAERALDAALAARNILAEYQRHEAAPQAVAA